MKLNVITQGPRQAPDLILLHGWSFSHKVWEPLITELCVHWRTHQIDLPGHGHSPAVEGDASINAYCEILAQQLPQSAHYLGWSLGGIIATHMALYYPQRVNKLVLVASTPQFVCSDDWALGMNSDVFALFKKNMNLELDITLKKFMALQSRGDSKQKALKKMLRNIEKTTVNTDIKGLNDGLTLLEQCNLKDKLQSITNPCLIMQGEHDAMVPVQASHYLHKNLVDAQLCIFPESGHLPFFHDKDLFLTTLADFLDD